MTFIITLLALVIERFFHWGHLRHWQWFSRYQRWLMHTRIGSASSYLVLAATILPPVLLAGLINLLLDDWLYGILRLIFGVFVLMYCLGPYNLWLQVYAGIDDLRKDDPKAAVEHMQNAFGIPATENAQAFHQEFVRAIFLAANQRVFAVVLWFVLLGPLGAVLYRAVALSAESKLTLSATAAKLQRLLDWLPARILTLIFALGGHFTRVRKCFTHKVFAGFNNDDMITACGVAALDFPDINQLPEDGSAEREALALLDRVFVMWLVILAVLVLLI